MANDSNYNEASIDIENEEVVKPISEQGYADNLSSYSNLDTDSQQNYADESYAQQISEQRDIDGYEGDFEYQNSAENTDSQLNYADESYAQQISEQREIDEYEGDFKYQNSAEISYQDDIKYIEQENVSEESSEICPTSEEEDSSEEVPGRFDDEENLLMTTSDEDSEEECESRTLIQHESTDMREEGNAKTAQDEPPLPTIVSEEGDIKTAQDEPPLPTIVSEEGDIKKAQDEPPLPTIVREEGNRKTIQDEPPLPPYNRGAPPAFPPRRNVSFVPKKRFVPFRKFRKTISKITGVHGLITPPSRKRQPNRP